MRSSVRFVLGIDLLRLKAWIAGPIYCDNNKDYVVRCKHVVHHSEMKIAAARTYIDRLAIWVG